MHIGLYIQLQLFLKLMSEHKNIVKFQICNNNVNWKLNKIYCIYQSENIGAMELEKFLWSNIYNASM